MVIFGLKNRMEIWHVQNIFDSKYVCFQALYLNEPNLKKKKWRTYYGFLLFVYNFGH